MVSIHAQAELGPTETEYNLWYSLTFDLYVQWKRATSMLVTDVGDEICLQQLWDVGDGFGRFRLYFNIWVGHQHPKDVTKI